MSGIRLHPEYGLNPSLGTCFWCGGDDGTVVLLGYNKGKEAPRHVLASYEPCTKCKAQMALGITCIEAKHSPCFAGQMPMRTGGGDTYPTGNWAVVTEEAVTRILSDSRALLASVLNERKVVMEPGTAKAIGLFVDPAVPEKG